MKVPALILAIFMASVVAAGQVLTAKDDISAEKYLAAEKKGKEELWDSSYRSTFEAAFVLIATGEEHPYRKTVEEYEPLVGERILDEELLGDKVMEEKIFIGNSIYYRKNGGKWSVQGYGHSFARFDEGSSVSTYHLAPSVVYQGGKADLYTRRTSGTRLINYMKAPVTEKYTRIEQAWYSLAGSLLRKVEDETVDGYKYTRHKVTTYEYNPKDLKIEAPIK